MNPLLEWLKDQVPAPKQGPKHVPLVWPETGQDMLTFKQWDNDPWQTGTMKEVQGCTSIWKELAFLPSLN